MKYILSLSILLVSLTSNAQLLGGAVKDEGRKIVGQESFIREDRINGWIKYEVAVNREGEVMSARVVETNVKSTPVRVGAKKHPMALKFEKGNHFPKHHHAIVKFTLVKAE